MITILAANKVVYALLVKEEALWNMPVKESYYVR